MKEKLSAACNIVLSALKVAIDKIFPATTSGILHYLLISIIYYFVAGVRYYFLFWNVPLTETKSSASDVILNLINNGFHGYYNAEFGFSFYASRMPFVPYFYAGLGSIFPDNLWFIHFIKNLIFLTIFFYTIHKALIFSGNHKYFFSAILSFILLSQQYYVHLLAIDFEEGFIIPLFAPLFLIFFFYDNFEAKGKTKLLILFSLLLLVLYLTKSSLLYFCFLFPVLFYNLYKDRRILVYGYPTLIIAMSIWGYYNFSMTGNFKFTSSSDGMNFFKGNNPYARQFYPRDLDGLYIKRPAYKLRDEWEFNNYYFAEAGKFITSHPVKFFELTSLKLFAFFLDFNIVPYGIPFGKFKYPILVCFNIIARILFFSTIFLSIFYILNRKEPAKQSLFYFLIVITYSAPFILGFAYTRHFYPLLIPVLFYLIRIRTFHSENEEPKKE